MVRIALGPLMLVASQRRQITLKHIARIKSIEDHLERLLRSTDTQYKSEQNRRPQGE